MATVSTQTLSEELARITSTTADMYLPQLANHVSNGYATWRTFLASGIKSPYQGGKQRRVPLELASPDRAKSVGEYGTFDTTPANVRTAAVHPLSRYISGWSIDNLELIQGSGPSAIKPLLKLELDTAMDDLVRRLNIHMWLDGTAAANDLVGFEEIVTEAPSLGTYGGVSRVNNALYRSTETQNTALSALVTNGATAMTSVTSGQDMPSAIFVGRTVRDLFEGRMTQTIRVDPLVIANGGAGDLSIKDLMFRGARIVTDEDAQPYGGNSGLVAVMVNFGPVGRRYWHLEVVPGEGDFKNMTEVRPEKQDVVAGGIRWVGTFYCSRLNRQAVMHDIQVS